MGAATSSHSVHFLCMHGELDQNIVLDQVVRHAGIDDREVLAVDGKFGVHRHFLSDLDLGGEGDALRDAVEFEVAADRMSRAVSPPALIAVEMNLPCGNFSASKKSADFKWLASLAGLNGQRSDVDIEVHLALGRVGVDQGDSGREKL